MLHNKIILDIKVFIRRLRITVSLFFNSAPNAFKSCLAWCVCWLAAFWLSGCGTALLVYRSTQQTYSTNSDIDFSVFVSTTVLGLTIGFIAANFPKLISYALGWGSDFNFSRNIDIPKIFNRGVKFLPSSVLFAAALFFMHKRHNDFFLQDNWINFYDQINPFDIPAGIAQLWTASIYYWPTIICLLFAQLILSWPYFAVSGNGINTE